MTTQSWRLSVYDIKPGAIYTVPGDAHHFLYVEKGEAMAASASGMVTLPTESGHFPVGGEMIHAGERTWLYEVRPGAPGLRTHEDLTPVLSRTISIGEGAMLLRADRIDQPAGMVTPSHHHRGPGIRRLSAGLLLAEVGDHVDLIQPGQAWFETGREAVVGSNISDKTNIFIRIMLLPAELEDGKSSFVATTPADAARPRGVVPRVFGERMLA
ncbi:hypothetical protein E8L99_17605 [Phreatobacter aquaticus]|uniref:Cupin domain-containing protein n=1 Tax=Phreatobacter aquaticus TaxID=2570229 RepID=A0A4D7QNC4_9HYPH|nr:hypothetical protein [Phreatobacter aquaticus]QCK87443.1 hypothetical protein E8L99_17605 [Phreatobacter aquaticus]